MGKRVDDFHAVSARLMTAMSVESSPSRVSPAARSSLKTLDPHAAGAAVGVDQSFLSKPLSNPPTRSRGDKAGLRREMTPLTRTSVIGQHPRSCEAADRSLAVGKQVAVVADPTRRGPIIQVLDPLEPHNGRRCG